jgi:hypothetical protein
MLSSKEFVNLLLGDCSHVQLDSKLYMCRLNGIDFNRKIVYNNELSLCLDIAIKNDLLELALLLVKYGAVNTSPSIMCALINNVVSSVKSTWSSVMYSRMHGVNFNNQCCELDIEQKMFMLTWDIKSINYVENAVFKGDIDLVVKLIKYGGIVSKSVLYVSFLCALFIKDGLDVRMRMFNILTYNLSEEEYRDVVTELCSYIPNENIVESDITRWCEKKSSYIELELKSCIGKELCM